LTQISTQKNNFEIFDTSKQNFKTIQACLYVVG